MNPHASPEVLAATVRETNPRIQHCLPDCELTFVRTDIEAERTLLQVPFRPVIIDMQFNGCRMLDLLEYVRALPSYRDVPVVCVQGADLHMSVAVRTNVEQGVRALGGSAFLDIRWNAETLEQSRRYLQYLLSMGAARVMRLLSRGARDHWTPQT